MESIVKDIYFDKNYGKLYENIENGEAIVFEYEDKNGKISNQFIKREIPIKINGKTYYDITTPYGYGGPIIEYCSGDKNNLLQEYKKKFSIFCNNNNIVSEFIRFHPLFDNALDFKNIYDVVYMRKTLGTNLEKYDNPVESEFSRSCRKTIRQVLKSGVTYNIIERPKEFETFKRVYYSNMDRKGATDYYYFKDEYFEKILKYFKDNIIMVQAIYENKIIAAGLYFIYNNIIHIHLSGTDTEYLHLSPAYVLKYATAIWGKEHNYKVIHYGGGLTNSEEDTLYLFKKKFAQNTQFDFYIGKKIWNQEIYNELCKKKGINEKDINFFPAYRKEQ